MKWRSAYWLPGVLLVLIGVFLPQDWYDALPKQERLPPPPFKGIILLQISFILEGFVLIWLSLNRWTFSRLSEVQRLPVAAASEENESLSDRTFLLLLAAVTLLALALRLFRVDSDLWLDEITPLLDYGHLSALEVIGTYLSTNNHLLNTLLVKLSVANFGEQEWAIRLPAVIFGTATIPVLYWVARLVSSRWTSFAAALLLAVSYHHIFFSQNARGYSAYLFFSLLSSGLFIRALQQDRLRLWILYGVAMFLNFASLLLSAFVFAAHILVGAVALFVVKRRGVPPLPLFQRLLAVLAVPAFLAFQLYATVLPQVYVNIRTVYTSSRGSGFSPFSGEFLSELIRGVSAGFGTGFVLGVLPFLVLAGAGFIILFRRQWALAAVLALPLLLTAAYLVSARLNFSPRFFLLGLPLAILSVVPGTQGLTKLTARIVGKSETVFSLRLATGLVLAVCIISLASLRYYYSVPKQSYRASLEYLESQRKSGEIVIVIFNAEKGFLYYGKRLGIREDYFFVRSVEALDAALSSRPRGRSYLVTTFPRSLRIYSPELEARISSGWKVAQRFPATIGDGQISVWIQN